MAQEWMRWEPSVSHRVGKPVPTTHIHLDPIGGIAGDMFVAAMLNALPAHEAAVIAASAALSGVACRQESFRDAVLCGGRFVVDHHHLHGHHHHRHWRDIRASIEQSGLAADVRQHAIGIFAALAEAEARVHGRAVNDVSFHEVGNADSIADIVAAAVLIGAVGPANWSVGSLPMGGGSVQTAHGVMPVPAPATALLLEGFLLHDDGIEGERVTPTGAAILKYVGARSSGPGGKLLASGYGFGTRQLPGRSNVLRVLVLQRLADQVHRELGVITFEVDDQSAEDLAAGLDRVRAHAGVHDVLQAAVFGKKGRMATQVQVLARPDLLDEIVEECFFETTTIGLRTQVVHARALPRRSRDFSVDGIPVRVKQVERPGGVTGKAESDDVLVLAGHAARAAARQRAVALAEVPDDA